jgi:hypothetical protein
MPTVVSLSIRNRAAAILFVVVLLALGAVFLTVGLALLAGLAVAGGLIGAGMAAYRMLRGGNRTIHGRRFDQLNRASDGRISGLDPTLEVSPSRAAIVRPANGIDSEP